MVVGGCNPVENYARQVGSFPQEGVKIRHIHINQHLVTLSMCVFIEVRQFFLYSLTGLVVTWRLANTVDTSIPGNSAADLFGMVM